MLWNDLFDSSDAKIPEAGVFPPETGFQKIAGEGYWKSFTGTSTKTRGIATRKQQWDLADNVHGYKNVDAFR